VVEEVVVIGTLLELSLVGEVMGTLKLESVEVVGGLEGVGLMGTLAKVAEGGVMVGTGVLTNDPLGSSVC
jgi:hypothetical protein